MSVSTFEQLQRQDTVVPVTLYAGDMPNVPDTETTSFINFFVFRNSVIRRLVATAQAITGSSQFVIKLKRGGVSGTVLLTLTSAVPYSAGVAVDSGEVTVPIYAGETLTLVVNGTDADTDDITALLIQAGLQPVADQDDA
jgi:hypothetical protein